MYYKHGTYQHGDNMVTLTAMSHQTSFSEFGLPDTVTKRLTIEGIVDGGEGAGGSQSSPSTQATIKTAIQLFETAYLDTIVTESGLYHDDNAQSPHYLNGSDSLNGIQITELSYPDGTGAEYATQRKFRVTMQTVEDATATGSGGGGTTNTAFEESLAFFGGGPRLVALEVLDGPPVIQQVTSATAQIVTQSGTATAQGGYPTIPTQLFPITSEDWSQHRETLISPRLVGQELRDWRADWSFTFVLDTPTTGEPNRPIP